jgi:hypothetical protein
MHRPCESVPLRRGEEDVLLDVVEVLVRKTRLRLRERGVGLRLGVRLEGPEVVLEPGDERDVPYGLLACGCVEEVLEHAAVDVAVLRLGGAPRPRREEDVGRCRAAHGLGDGLGVLEVSDHGRDALVDAFGVTAQAGDVPAVGEQTPRQIASADARDANDESTPAHGVPRSAASGDC